MKAKRALLRLCPILIAFSLKSLFCITSVAAQTPAQTNCRGGITVHGRGAIGAVPDIVVYNVGVSNSHTSSAQALRDNAQTVQKIIEVLDARGIAKRDIVTEHVFLRDDSIPERSSNRTRRYLAHSMLGITVRDISLGGKVLQALVDVGVNDVGNLEFGHSKRSELLDRARENAIADARRKAEVYAREASLKLGKICSINEPLYATNSNNRGEESFSLSSTAHSVPLEQGVEVLAVDVTVNFSLQP